MTSGHSFTGYPLLEKESHLLPMKYPIMAVLFATGLFSNGTLKFSIESTRIDFSLRWNSTGQQKFQDIFQYNIDLV